MRMEAIQLIDKHVEQLRPGDVFFSVNAPNILILLIARSAEADAMGCIYLTFFMRDKLYCDLPWSASSTVMRLM